jgi:titin
VPDVPVPSTPQITAIDIGDSEAYISFSVANNGGSLPITSYDAICFDGATEYTGTSSTSPITVSGLTNGVSYTCSVTAASAAGTSEASAPTPPFTPELPAPPTMIPSTPRITNIDYGDEDIYLTVSDSGSSTISSYTATCTDGTTEYTGTSSTSRITVSGLTNGVGYSCSVTATNAAGTSAPSAPSLPLVPEYIPTGLPIWLLYEAVKSASP